MTHDDRPPNPVWDIPSRDGNGIIHVSPEILANMIDQLTGEVILHRQATHELLVICANLVQLDTTQEPGTRSDLATDILKRITMVAKAMRFKQEDAQHGGD